MLISKSQSKEPSARMSQGIPTPFAPVSKGAGSTPVLSEKET
jgi:hypothetical protein